MTTSDHSRRIRSLITWYGGGIAAIAVILLIALPRL